MVVHLRSMFLCSLACTFVLWYTTDLIPVFGSPWKSILDGTKRSEDLLFVDGTSYDKRQQGDSGWMDPSWMIHQLPSGQIFLQDRVNQSVHDDDNVSSTMRIIQGINASVDIVWEQVHHYVTTANWNRSVFNLFVVESFSEFNSNVNVTLFADVDGALEQHDGHSKRRKPRRSKQAMDEKQQQEQYHTGIRMRVKLFPILFPEQSYLLHFSLVPQKHVIFWNWTVDTLSPNMDANSTAQLGTGYVFLLQQSSNPPVTRLFNSMGIEWVNLFPAPISKLMEFVPPVEGMIRSWFTHFIWTKVIRHVKEQSENLQSVLSSKPEDHSDLCSATQPFSHKRIPQILRHWWRNIRRLLPSEGDHDDRYFAEDGFCEIQPTNVTFFPINQTDTSAPIPGVRPIGVTRYLLVCSVLSLTLFNVYLFFS